MASWKDEIASSAAHTNSCNNIWTFLQMICAQIFKFEDICAPPVGCKVHPKISNTPSHISKIKKFDGYTWKKKKITELNLKQLHFLQIALLKEMHLKKGSRSANKQTYTHAH